MKTILALCIFLFSLPAPIEGKRVYDLAEQLSAESKTELQKIIAETESKTTAEIAVVTIWSLDGQDIDSYANELFNSWGIGKKEYNNGILFVTGINERRTRIEVGRGLEPLITDALAGEILDNEVIPFFKDGNIEAGIVSGTKEIAKILQRYPEAAKGQAGSLPGFVMTSSKKALLWAVGAIAAGILLFCLSFWFGKKRTYSADIFILFGIILAGLFFMAYQAYKGLSGGTGPLAGAGATGFFALYQNFRRYRRYRPHPCKECGTQMSLLDEATDDQKLSKEEKFEEQLGSVDYDVWQCPACSNTEINNYNSFSSYSACPGCKRRTYSIVTQTIIAATYSSSGTAKHTGTCKLCQYKSETMHVIPRLTRSSSGSSGSSGGGSSFGGGSSGGGGSSRGW